MKYCKQAIFMIVLSATPLIKGEVANISALYTLDVTSLMVPYSNSFGSTIDCDDAGVEKLGSMMTLFEVDSCFNDVSDSFSSLPKMFSVSNFSSYASENTGAFKRQNNICSCVNSKRGTGKSQLEMRGDLTSSETFVLAHLQDALNRFKVRSQYTHNMMILHAQAMGEGEALKYQLDEAVQIGESYKDFVNKTIEDVVTKNTTIMYGAKTTLDQKVKNIIQTSATIDDSPSVINVLRDQEVEGESCLSMKDFLLRKSFPLSNAFWSNIGNNFSEEDWNSNNLRKKYITNKLDVGQEEIAARIEFLEKNPLVKMVFDSGDKEAASKVFNVIKKHMKAGHNCESKPTGCHGDFIGKKVGAYNQEIAEVFKEPAMVALIKKQRKADTEKQIGELVTSSSQRLSINSLNSWANQEFGTDLDHCTNILKFTVAIKGFSRMQQYEDAAKRKCEEFIPKYCEQAGNVLRQGSFNEAITGPKEKLLNLYQSTALEMDPDPTTNGNYQIESEKVCQNHRRYHNGKSLNVEEFRSSICSGQQDSGICSNKEALLREFLTLPEDKVHNVEQFAEVSENFVRYLDVRPKIETMSEQTQSRFKKSGGSITSLFKSDEKLKNNDFESFASPLSETASAPLESTEAAGAIKQSQHSPFVNNSHANHFTDTLSNIKDSKEEVDKEIKSTKEAIAANKQRLARTSTTPEFKSEINDRVKMLESLLAEKEKSSQEYQKIINQLMQNQENPQPTAARKIASVKNADEEVEERTSTPKGRMVAASSSKNDNLEERSLANISHAESFSTAGGMRGGAASLGSSSASAVSAATAAGKKGVNSALLAKYGITVQENGANVQVASDQDTAQISALLKNANQSDIGLQVSKLEYEKFKNNDLTALNKLYQEKLEMIENNVVKLMIHSDGESESLEFYAIKEDGKIVFQPVRKTKLSDLKNALIQ